MPEIHGIIVGSTSYQYDYDDLADKPATLPASSASDAGKALTVNSSGNPAWNSISTVPSSGQSDTGKALMVNNSGNPAWTTIPPSADIPDPSEAPLGACLTVGADGTLEWSEERLLPDWENAWFGDYLVISSCGGTGPVWAARSEIPDTEYASDGDVLKYTSDSGIHWGTAGGGSDLPDPSSAPDGACLVVSNSGEDLNWVVLVPDSSTEPEGALLVVGGFGAPEWRMVIPPFDESDDGKVLMVDGSNGLYWGTLP